MDNLSKSVISKIKRNICHNNANDFKKYGVKGTLTYEEFIDQIQKQGNKCYVCLQEFKYDGRQWCYFFPSADRINNDSRHSKENLGASCVFCNIRNFKQISEKACGLCEGLNHIYQGHIISKSSLFFSLRHTKYQIKEYIDSINEDEFKTINEKIRKFDGWCYKQ